jgi:hypothetical protein
MTPRADLPGQLYLPATEKQPADLARRKTAAPMRPVVGGRSSTSSAGYWPKSATRSRLFDLRSWIFTVH